MRKYVKEEITKETSMEVVENIESMIHILIDSIPKVENK
jgi:hypothetical protein